MIPTDTLRMIRKRRAEILALAAKRGAKNIRVFGSVARGDANERSDIDFLVEFEPGRTLVDHAGLVDDLERLLGARVDVVSQGALHPLMRQTVLAEAVAV